MGGSKHCAFFGCRNSTRISSNLSFFKLPLCAKRRLKWLKIMNRMDLAEKELNPKSYVVCSKHFSKSALVMMPRLKANALPIAEVDELSRDQATQTDLLDLELSDKSAVKIEPKDTVIEDCEMQVIKDENTEIEDSENSEIKDLKYEDTRRNGSENIDTELDIKQEIEVSETEVASPVNKTAVKRPGSSLSKWSPNTIKLEKTETYESS